MPIAIGRQILFSSMSETLTADQLEQVKSTCLNSVVNSLSLSALVNLAGAKLAADLPEGDEAGLRDAVISQTNLDTWNALVAQLKEMETETD